MTAKLKYFELYQQNLVFFFKNCGIYIYDPRVLVNQNKPNEEKTPIDMFVPKSDLLRCPSGQNCSFWSGDPT